MYDVLLFIGLLALGYTTGTIAEKRHYRSIERRENIFLKTPIVTLKEDGTDVSNVDGAMLVMGSAVISLDYFKRFLFGLRNIFGGEVAAFGSLVDRARREAILRMVESSYEAGSPAIILNLRIETSSIGRSSSRRRNKTTCIEVLAYGTAIYKEHK